MKGRAAILAITLGAIVLAACTPAVSPSQSPPQVPTASEEEPTMTPGASSFRLTSGAFGEGEPIPRQYTCDGADLSPPLAWEGAPDGTAAYALIVDDPDARGWVHWVLLDLPRTTTALAEGAGDAAGLSGVTDFGRTGWGGPCPPSGEHRYDFVLYALSQPLGLEGAPSAAQAREALADRVLGEARLTGVYRRG